MRYRFINTRLMRGGASAVLYRNQKPAENLKDQFIVTVFDGPGEGVSHPFQFRSQAVKWRETLRTRK